MKLYDSKFAPNPRRVRIFLAEKGVSVPTELVDLGTLQHKSEDFAGINPLQRVPALVLDDGTVITESVAICRYFEIMQPDPPLFGRDGLEPVMVEMWQRRLEINFFFPIAHVFRHTHPAMKEMEVPQVLAWAEANKPRVLEFLPLLDRQLAQHRFVAGDRYSIADITALVSVDFLKPIRLAVQPEFKNVLRWYAEVSARPSARA